MFLESTSWPFANNDTVKTPLLNVVTSAVTMGLSLGKLYACRLLPTAEEITIVSLDGSLVQPV